MTKRKSKGYSFSIVCIAMVLLQCKTQEPVTLSPPQGHNVFTPDTQDSLVYLNYVNQIRDEYTEEDPINGDIPLVELHRIKGLSDLALRVYTVSGESCGAYCNPFYSNLITLNNEKIMEKSLGIVDTIFLLDSNHAAIVSSGWGRPAGYYTITFKSLLVLEWEKDSLLHSIPIQHLEHSEKEDLFAISTPHYLDPTPDIHFSDDTLFYSYAMDLLNWQGIDSCYRVRGSFLYSTGEFTPLFEEKTAISREEL